MVQEILLGLQEPQRSGKYKTMDPDAVIQAIEVNLVSCTWRVSGKLGILQFNVVHHLHDLKSMWSCQIVPHAN